LITWPRQAFLSASHAMKHLRFRPELTALFVACITPLAHAADGAALFKQHCALCHGKDGKANTPVARKFGAKDLSLSKTEDAEVTRQIREGKRDDKGKQLMPPFGEKLSAEDITALVGTVKAFRQP
jgi:mono/diheme cytochrome c family protein